MAGTSFFFFFLTKSNTTNNKISIFCGFVCVKLPLLFLVCFLCPAHDYWLRFLRRSRWSFSTRTKGQNGQCYTTFLPTKKKIWAICVYSEKGIVHRITVTAIATDTCGSVPEVSTFLLQIKNVTQVVFYRSYEDEWGRTRTINNVAN